MAEGLVQAALATLKTREWAVEGEPLTGEQVVALYWNLPGNQWKIRHLIGDVYGSRRWDRAIQILKAAGLVEYRMVRGVKQWWPLHMQEVGSA